MADPIYDPESADKQPGKELRDQEQKAPSHERQITSPASRAKSGSKKGQSSKEAGEQSDSGSLYSPGQSDSTDSQDDLYSGGVAATGRRLAGVFGASFRPKHLVALVLVGGILSTMFAFSGLFSELKMNGIMSNIDTNTFARLNGSLDVRNNDYIRTYMELRLADVCPSTGSCSANDLNLSSPTDSDNLIFRSGKVSRGNPIFNWYRTLRSSNFEQDVFNKHGIILTSESYRSGNIIKFRTAKITFNGQDINGIDVSTDPRYGALADAASKGDWVTFGKLANSSLFNDFVKSLPSEEFLSNAERRAAVREFVNSNTQPWQVFKRRQLRKDIASKTGIRQWRFFDDTRTKIDQKKLSIRNNLIDAITPEGTKSGAFIDCLFGISDCKFSGDPSNPANQASGPGSEAKPSTEDKAPPGEKSVTVDYSKAAQSVSKAIGGAFDIVNAAQWASLINSLATVDHAISTGAIEGQVAIARGTQAMALYQTFETIRDQMQTGQVQPDEVNQFMQAIGNFTASEAWVKVVEGKGTPGVTAEAAGVAAAVKYCGSHSQPSDNQFAYLCNKQIIGGASGATAIQDAYNGGPGKVLSPILSTYKKYLGWFGDTFNFIFGKFSSAILTPVFNLISDVPGVKNDLSHIMGWATNQIAQLLGAGPIYYTNSDGGKTKTLVPSGQLAGGVIQGAAYTAEASMRDNGGALTTPASQSTAEANTLAFEAAQSQDQSVIDKYLSPSNPQSLVGSGLFAISQFKLSSIGNIFSSFGSFFRTIGAALSLPINHQALAASNDFGYRAAEVAQIRTYDMPSQCFNQDPLTMTPASGTNIQSVFGSSVKPADLTWALVTNSQSWYAYVYSFAKASQPVPGKDYTYADEVYNCNLFDDSSRGDLGYLYGYTSDNGYDGTIPTAVNSTSGQQQSGGLPSGDTPTLAKQVLADSSISFSTNDAKQAVQDAANGQPAPVACIGKTVQLDPTLLAVLIKIADSHKISIGYITNGCHSSNSKHYQGKAADIVSVDGRPTNGGDNDRAFMHEVTGILPNGSGMGQQECSSLPISPINQVNLFDDSCDHIHIEVP